MPTGAPDGTSSRPRTTYKEIREVELKSFSQRLWRQMVKKGWNQSELARQSGVGRDIISGYVRAKHLPDAPHAGKLATALGVDVQDLLPGLGAAPELAAPRATRDMPPVELRATGDGKAMLHLNLELPMELAVQVLALIQQPAA